MSRDRPLRSHLLRSRPGLALGLALALAIASQGAAAQDAFDAGPDRADTLLEALRDGRIPRAVGEIVRRSGRDDPTPGGERAMARLRARVYLESIDRALGPVHDFHRAAGRPDGFTWLGFEYREDAAPDTKPEAQPLDAFFVVDFAHAGEHPVQIARTPDFVTTVRVGFANDDEEARRLRRDVVRSLFDAAADAGL